MKEGTVTPRESTEHSSYEGGALWPGVILDRCDFAQFTSPICAAAATSAVLLFGQSVVSKSLRPHGL